MKSIKLIHSKDTTGWAGIEMEKEGSPLTNQALEMAFLKLKSKNPERVVWDEKLQKPAEIKLVKQNGCSARSAQSDAG